MKSFNLIILTAVMFLPSITWAQECQSDEIKAENHLHLYIKYKRLANKYDRAGNEEQVILFRGLAEQRLFHYELSSKALKECLGGDLSAPTALSLTSVRAEANGQQLMQLSWIDDIDSSAEGYLVEQARCATCEFTEVARVGKSARSQFIVLSQGPHVIRLSAIQKTELTDLLLLSDSVQISRFIPAPVRPPVVRPPVNEGPGGDGCERCGDIEPRDDHTGEGEGLSGGGAGPF